jgi:hypothetical protein
MILLHAPTWVDEADWPGALGRERLEGRAVTAPKNVYHEPAWVDRAGGRSRSGEG